MIPVRISQMEFFMAVRPWMVSVLMDDLFSRHAAADVENIH